MLISLLKINVACPLCHDTHKLVGLNAKKMSNQMNVCMILGDTFDGDEKLM